MEIIKESASYFAQVIADEFGVEFIGLSVNDTEDALVARFVNRSAAVPVYSLCLMNLGMVRDWGHGATAWQRECRSACRSLVNSCDHNWQLKCLFTSTYYECSKCGKEKTN